MWTDEIFIDALTDALIQRTRPALYDQLDVVTTATDQRLKVESTAAIREWAAGAVSCLLTLPCFARCSLDCPDLEDSDSDSESQDESKKSTVSNILICILTVLTLVAQ